MNWSMSNFSNVNNDRDAQNYSTTNFVSHPIPFHNKNMINGSIADGDGFDHGDASNGLGGGGSVMASQHSANATDKKRDVSPFLKNSTPLNRVSLCSEGEQHYFQKAGNKRKVKLEHAILIIRPDQCRHHLVRSEQSEMSTQTPIQCISREKVALPHYAAP
mmetsp:Transcript_1746/g.4038  ORF Transcript_1746/g.4038 Transcript_1746/m.4038 type:complete len:161 (-) Transcript_1746:1328-1810(-)